MENNPPVTATSTANNESSSFTGEPIERNYTVIKKLKDNSEGSTTLVAQKSDKKLFILKHINATNLIYSKLSTLNSKYIPRITYVKENTDFNITTVIEEYLPGLTLNDWLKQRQAEPINDELAKTIFTQLASGLKTLHKNKIMHRSISLQHIIFTNDSVKFISFDHAIEGSTYNDINPYKGIGGFAPPEQYVMGKTDFRSDIYSLGRIMQSLLGENYHGRYAKVLKHCLAIVPDERYSSAKQLLRAIKTAGIISFRQLALFCVVLYGIIFGIITLVNHFYNPLGQLEQQRAFEADQKSVATAKDSLQNLNISADTNDSDNKSSATAKGDVSLSVKFPDKSQEESGMSTTIHMGKSSDKDTKTTFSDSDKLIVSVKNNTDSILTNPIIKLTPENMDISQMGAPSHTIARHIGSSVEYRHDISIPIGGEMQFEISLAGARILSDTGSNAAMKIVLSADNYKDVSTRTIFSFN